MEDSICASVLGIKQMHLPFSGQGDNNNSVKHKVVLLDKNILRIGVTWESCAFVSASPSFWRCFHLLALSMVSRRDVKYMYVVYLYFWFFFLDYIFSALMFWFLKEH